MSGDNKILGRQPVFGDEEQIKYLQECEQYAQQMLGGEMDVFDASRQVRAEISFMFNCAICMSPVHIESDVTIYSCNWDFSDELDQTKARCHKCNTQYEIVCNMDATILTISDCPKYPERVTKFKEDEESC